MKSRHSIVNKLMSRFSYSEKFVFISLMFALAIITLSYLMIHEEEEDIYNVQSEMQGIAYLEPLRKLLENVPEHKFLVHSYLNGNTSLKSSIITLQSQISDEIEDLQVLDQKIGNDLLTNETSFRLEEEKNMSAQEIAHKWDNIKTQTFTLSPLTSDNLHNDLITDIRGLSSHIGDTSRLLLDPELSSHYLMSVILVRLPDYQDTLFEIISILEEVSEQKKMNSEQHIRLSSQLALLKSETDSIRKGIFKVYKNNKDESLLYLKDIIPELNAFLEANQVFQNFIQTHFLHNNEITTPIAEILNEGTTILNSSFTLWDESVNLLDEKLHSRSKALRMKEFYGLGVATIFALVAFCVGLFIMRQISLPLNNLITATRSLAGGDLTTRVPISYQDEIGKVGIAFNNMAQSFQTIIGQLRELLEAIKSLANGDFSARVKVSNPNDEIGQVGYSFNNMAQSFEDIIGQLHRLGINLTTSATQIATASKDQETIIMEQEATTREISVTANEISTTAKAFATTVNEISRVAEDTSELAAKGMESLNHMEIIMRQMVDASGSIAAKLAVLNEKAGNITSVITTITKVADQTNLLSLNASIEAEKAGEFGKSFAVIAREIRRLADQTAFATLDIEKIVNEIMSAVSSSVMGVDDFTQEIRGGVDQTSKVGEQLAKIIQQVQNLTERFESVNQGMQTQSAGAEQINEAISQLSQTAQQTTESIHQFRTTINQLNSSATDLRIAVTKIKK